MALDLLGDGFDLHGGGIDLAFPHHENERAQAVGRHHAFARHWVHNGMVESGGVKMSKSLGNFTSLTDLLEQGAGRAYRLLVMRAHYRSPITVDEATLADAQDGLERLDVFARKAAASGAGFAAVEPDAAALDHFRAFMDDDLNTPRATAVLFDLVRRANNGDASAAAAALEICRAVGLELRVGDDEVVDDETRSLMTARDGARAARDWARADGLRTELQDAGWIVEDGPEGTTVRRRT
jgi:cysteinyl-tRNA synthetase